MRTFTGRAFARLLEARGWRLLRVNGSHFIYWKDDHVTDGADLGKLSPDERRKLLFG